MELELYVDSSAEYVCRMKLIDWKLDDLYSYGERNFDFDSGVFLHKGRFDPSVSIFHDSSLDKLLDTVYDEIKYMIKVYDFVERKSFYKKYEISF